MIPFVGAVLGLNVAVLLTYLSDMQRRGVKGVELVRWAVGFALFGPFAVAWYRSGRPLQPGEVREGRRLHHVAQHFVMPWSVFVLTLPVLVLVVAAVSDIVGSGYAPAGFLLETVGWSILLFMMFVVPLIWLPPVLVASIISARTRPARPQALPPQDAAPTGEAVTTGSPAESPAAWHPDPLVRHELRYWDGRRWTGHVADGGVVATDPIGDEGDPRGDPIRE